MTSRHLVQILCLSVSRAKLLIAHLVCGGLSDEITSCAMWHELLRKQSAAGRTGPFSGYRGLLSGALPRRPVCFIIPPEE
jgi:hypothetical protein